MFARWGRFVYRWRWATLVVSVVLLGGFIYSLMAGGTLGTGNSTSSTLEAARAARLINDQLSTGKTGGSNFLLIFSSPDRLATDPVFQTELENALAPIQHDPRVTDIISPYTGDASTASAFISKDGHKALVRVDIKSEGEQARADYTALRAAVHPSGLTVVGTGNVPINRDFSATLESDLARAETVTLPVTLILLLLIFGTVVAAGLPLGIGICTIVGGLAGTFLLSRVTDVSQYALNIVTLIGLAVAIDYSLFIVNRFRDELAAGKSRPDALATTMATAGRAITFSGLAVAVGLSAMLFYQGTFLASLGAAGAIVVGVAVFYGLTFLPALLAVLGPNGQPAVDPDRGPTAEVRSRRLAPDGYLGDAPPGPRARACPGLPGARRDPVPSPAPRQCEHRPTAAKARVAAGLRHPGQEFSWAGPD